MPSILSPLSKHQKERSRWFPRTSHQRFWLGISLLIPLVYGAITLALAFQQPYTIQDDVRQHGVWMQRWIDPALFDNDWIADYFLTVAPIGYRAVYGTGIALGLDPQLIAKLLPLPLALIASVFMFRFSLRLFPNTAAAVLTVFLFNQQLWLNDDLVSSSPRAFVYPIFAAFLDFLAAGQVWPCVGAIALQGLFFPQLVLLAVGVLSVRLLELRQGRLRFTQNRRAYWFWGIGTLVAIAILLPFALNLSAYGPAITADPMRQMPEYSAEGRNAFFGNTFPRVLFLGAAGFGLPYFPSVILLGFALPFLSRKRFPLIRRFTGQIRILDDLIAAALVLFLAAHALLLRLHFPNRYTYHTWRFALSVATALLIVVLADAAWKGFRRQREAQQPITFRQRLWIGIVGLVLAIVTLVPLYPPLIWLCQNWRVGQAPAIYAYLAEQPPSIRVASLAEDANNIPAFAQRSVYVGREFALPHHPRYYAEIRRHAAATVTAQYTPDPAVLHQILTEEAIDFWVIEANALSAEYLQNQDWLIHSSIQATTNAAIAHLQQNQTPAIAPLISQCQVVNADPLFLLDATCLKQATQPGR